MAGTGFEQLEADAARLKTIHLRELFARDAGRFAKFCVRLDDLTIDFSKEKIDDRAMTSLLALARAAGVEARRDAMAAGEAINETEGRAVLHLALRGRPEDGFSTGGEPVGQRVEDVLEKVCAFADAVRNGDYAGQGGAFTDVVNIGIGGSDLGPAMVCRALTPFRDGGPTMHFVSNVDGAHISDTLAGLDPARTLVIIASKTFTTQETMTNAATARDWLIKGVGKQQASKHLAAISTNLEATAAFGIPQDRVFGFWDWVGGRYSVWSAIGLSVAMAIGGRGFREFLKGARAMDRHFLAAPLAENLPVLLALIGIWRRNGMGCSSVALIPYDQRLERFSAYVQQLDMESNGKSVGLDGGPVGVATGPVIWGQPGANAQHSFFQLLHQGTDIIPVDFILAARGQEQLGEHHLLLTANCLAQSQALAFGKTEGEVRAEMQAKGIAQAEIDRLAPHRTFQGDRPSTMILHKALTPFTLGRLIALYEHKVFVQGIIWGINSFDQWGVELGKQLAGDLIPILKGEQAAGGKDASTAGLVARLKELGAD